MSENYQLVYQSREKFGNYRDTGVSKNAKFQHFNPGFSMFRDKSNKMDNCQSFT